MSQIRRRSDAQECFYEEARSKTTVFEILTNQDQFLHFVSKRLESIFGPLDIVYAFFSPPIYGRNTRIMDKDKELS